MTGEISINGTKGVQQVNYLKQGDVTPLTQKEKETFSDMLKRLYPDKTEDGYSKITDKNGVERTGKVITTEPVSLLEILRSIKNGKKIELNKPLATVKEAQVNKFLESIKFLGLDLKAEDIMTKNGTLNPNFKVDDKGNISFRNLKSYINGDVPEYFETKDGKWAQAPSQPVTKWTALNDKIKISDKVKADDTAKKIPLDGQKDSDKDNDASSIDPWFSIKLNSNKDAMADIFKKKQGEQQSSPYRDDKLDLSFWGGILAPAKLTKREYEILNNGTKTNS